ncbi:glycoside hydrolase [Thraustotheca clavata]|uniref:Glycoside hydrolase n=1 Tax=Thraustotheca clavata TaxID=74557 RepID=A0A1V9ZZU8_9STRA|nr:glycoside hydrolase [Thraustotheca clavata]
MKTLFIVALLLFINVINAGDLKPIVVRGNKLYDSSTGERFFIRGITYEGDVSDDYYEDFVRATLDTALKDMFGYFNAIRLYNVNPDKSYAKFMRHMDEKKIYVVVSASPTDKPYYGDYGTQTMDRTVNAEGTISSIDRVITQLQTKTKTCYPAYLLKYGKMIIKNFAQYDNTLAIVVGNEVLQYDLTAGACLKMYAADLKDWMGVMVNKLRKIPLAYSAANGQYDTDATKKTQIVATTYHVAKIQGLLCGDKMVNGTMKKSIDIYMINEYSWCHTKDTFEVYQKLLDLAQGVPIAMALGEFGCAVEKPRTWGMVPYLFSDNKTSNGWTDAYSGGFAYSFGEACLTLNTMFALFVGSTGTGITDKPGTKPTNDYTNLLKQYQDNKTPTQKAEFTKDTICSYAPPNTQPIKAAAAQTETWMPSCSSKVIKLQPTDNWITSSREGIVCHKNGTKCEVPVETKVGTSEEDICGHPLVVESGGDTCTPGDGTCIHGKCMSTVKSAGRCVCSGCWSGGTCSLKNDAKCSALTSMPDAPKIIFTCLAAFLGVMTLIFGGLAVASCNSTAKFKKSIPQDNTQSL